MRQVSAFTAFGIIVSLLFYQAFSNTNVTPLAGCFPSGVNLYMTGTAGGRIVYWKNGVKTVPDSNGRKHWMPVSGENRSSGEAGHACRAGSDRYTAGVIAGADGNNQAAVWKNEIPTVLSRIHHSSEATGLVVVGRDVFVVGSVTDGNRERAACWKNEQEILLPGAEKIIAVVTD